MFPNVLPFLYRSKLPDYLSSTSASTSGAAWALVTGASDGIGQGFAQELAARGFNVLLHGRNRQKLEKVEQGLKESFPDVQTKLLVADASNFTSDTLNSIYTAVKDLPLRVLINNVGGTAMLRANFQPFGDHELEEIERLVSVNILFTVQLTRRLLPLLQANKPALIMNIGSQARAGVPFMSVYSGSKAFISTWSRCLDLELKDAGCDIEVLEILIAAVQSSSLVVDKPSFFIPSSRDMARSALNRVGCGDPSLFAYFPHALQWIGYSLIPRRIFDRLVINMLKPMVGKTDKKFD